MAQRSEILTVYTAGVIQGIALVTFPAAGAVFTSATDYGLSGTQYGGMFVPQAIMAIIASLLGAGWRSRLGTKRIYLLGLFANLLAMALLVLSRFVMQDHSLAYGILLVATTCMGIGFGFTVPALNTFAAAYFPQKVDKAVLWLNALLGLGTALAPVFIAVFVGLGIWWGLPVLVGALIIALLLFSLRQTLDEGDSSGVPTAQKAKFPPRFWVFAAFALLYGVCETMNGNWASLYLKEHFGAGTSLASLALTLFWATVTAGRILFAAIGKWFPETLACRVLPLVVSGGLHCQCVRAQNKRRARRGDVRPRRPRLLGLAAADHQFRPEGIDRHRRFGGRRIDRLLSDRLRHRGFRGRAAGIGRLGSASHLWRNGGCRARTVRVIVRRRAPITRARLRFS